jgi:hypothetical protein
MYLSVQPAHAQAPLTKNIPCHLLGGFCPGYLTLSHHNIKNDVFEHLSIFHDIPKCSGPDAPVQDCLWVGCTCSAHGPRCGTRLSGHTAHVNDLAEHIMHTHLGFRYACDRPRCGRAEWSSPFALRRHQRKCYSTATVRCPGCLEEFESEIMLGSHAVREGCYAL